MGQGTPTGPTAGKLPTPCPLFSLLVVTGATSGIGKAYAHEVSGVVASVLISLSPAPWGELGAPSPSHPSHYCLVHFFKSYLLTTYSVPGIFLGLGMQQ